MEQIKKFDVENIKAKLNQENLLSNLINKITEIVEDANKGIDAIGKHDSNLLKLKKSMVILNEMKNSLRIYNDYNNIEDYSYDPKRYEEVKPKIEKIEGLLKYCYAIQIAEDVIDYFDRKEKNGYESHDYAGLIESRISEYWVKTKF